MGERLLLEKSDGELVQLTLKGEKKAFGQLVEKYKDAAYAVAYSKIGSFTDAQDVAQEAFLKAYQKLSELREPSKFGSWLYSITVSASSDWLRKKRVSPISLDSLPNEDSLVYEEAAREHEGEKRLQDAVLDAINDLPETNRTTTTLYYIDGYSLEDISSFMNVPLGTVKRRLHDSRKRLKEEMIDMVKNTLDKNRLPDDFTARLLKYQGFVGKEIASMVDEDPGQIKLGGEIKDTTILFIDMVGFMHLIEGLSLKQCGDLLNQWFSEIGEIVFRYEGFIITFAGDAILIAFGIPNHVENHALKALKAALEMLDAMKRVEGGKMKVRIGINSGEVIAGFFGHPQRFSYDVLGHHVNLAAKMESIAEPNQILITQYTYERVKDRVNAERLKEAQVKGESKPLSIYSVRGMK